MESSKRNPRKQRIHKKNEKNKSHGKNFGAGHKIKEFVIMQIYGMRVVVISIELKLLKSTWTI